MPVRVTFSPSAGRALPLMNLGLGALTCTSGSTALTRAPMVLCFGFGTGLAGASFSAVEREDLSLGCCVDCVLCRLTAGDAATAKCLL
jgi:hypothetical protein